MAIKALIVAALAAAATATPLVVERDTSCTDGPIGNTCQVQCNVDYPGGDSLAIGGGTLADCANYCESNQSTCVTAQYNTGNGYCYVKNAINELHPSSNTNSVVCGVCGVSTTYGSTTCTIKCNQDRNGGNMGIQKFTANIHGCADLCGQTAGCVTAQFNHGNGYCYLKSTSNALTPSAGTDTVDCVSS